VYNDKIFAEIKCATRFRSPRLYEEDKRAGASDLKIFSGPNIGYTFITSRRLSAYTCNNISTLARRARAPSIICIRHTLYRVCAVARPDANSV